MSKKSFDFGSLLFCLARNKKLKQTCVRMLRCFPRSLVCDGDRTMKRETEKDREREQCMRECL